MRTFFVLQFKIEDTAFTEFALHTVDGTVAFENVFHNRQAKSRACHGAAVRFVHLVVAVENERKILFSDAFTVIVLPSIVGSAIV